MLLNGFSPQPTSRNPLFFKRSGAFAPPFGRTILFIFGFLPLFSFSQIDTLSPSRDTLVTPPPVSAVKAKGGTLVKKDTTEAGIIVMSDSVLTDSTLADSTQKKKRKRLKRGTPEWDAWASTLDPNVAWKRSAALPGLGQAYNRSYWKIPIVYAGFGTLGYFFVSNHIQYKNYQVANRCRLDPNCTDADTFPGLGAGTVVDARDFYRRNRDFTVILGVLWYGINIVDAYVEAHLKYFDVSDDLSLQFKPSLMMVQDQRRRLVPGAGLTLRIK